VHAFEPDPANRTRLQASFRDFPNVTIVPKGVSDTSGTVPLFSSDESTGISSLARFTDRHSFVATVETITLGEYMASAGVHSVDFMKIDVEGFELPVLRGYDWAIKPSMIVLEFEDFKTVPLGYAWTDLADELVARGYEVLVSEWFPIEHYGRGHQWRRFARYPTELQDPAAWGNLIATASINDLAPVLRTAVRRSQVRRRVDRIMRRGEGPAA
jgi:FkbM family methyltransferase